MNWKIKTVIYTLLALMFVGFGAFIRPGVDIAIEMVSSAVTPKQEVYQAPETEYEKRSKALFYSAKHQETCMAQAKATVSLQIVDEMLQESKKQQLKADYELPASLMMK